MKITCILCDQSFQPDKQTKKKILKHPHKIQLCPDCYVRIKNQVLERQKNQVQPTESETRVPFWQVKIGDPAHHQSSND